MTPLFSDGPLSEHAGFPNGILLENVSESENWQQIFFKNDKSRLCVSLSRNWQGNKYLQTSYFVGADWLEENKTAIYVEPKLNQNARQTDYFKMLFSGFENPEIATYLPEIFDIKLDRPQILLKSEYDILTPLLAYQFLIVLKDIVKKGLNKSHQTVTANLPNRIKGKLLINEHLKQNVFKHRPLQNFCRFQSFNVDGEANRILKKAFQFSVRFLAGNSIKLHKEATDKLISFIRPAFTEVGDDVNIRDLKHIRVGAFFKSYERALHLADLIFKRYGYNINSVNPNAKYIKVPPFWIDMSKLYELFVFSELTKHPYKKNVIFQPKGNYGWPDFLLTEAGHLTVIDAKYKPYYDSRYVIEDIRQLSAYARDNKILSTFNANFYLNNLLIDCLIIYPHRESSESNDLSLIGLKDNKIVHFQGFFKKAITLPVR